MQQTKDEEKIVKKMAFIIDKVTISFNKGLTWQWWSSSQGQANTNIKYHTFHVGIYMQLNWGKKKKKKIASNKRKTHEKKKKKPRRIRNKKEEDQWYYQGEKVKYNKTR